MLGRRIISAAASPRAFSTAAASSSSGAASVAQRGTTAINYRVIRFPPTRTPGYGANTHRSNRAKNGLYHGKDVQFGHSVSHSQVKSKRRWYPNVINKRVWSDALGDWVRFKMTTRALREIDNVGGIDTYLLALEEKQVTDSNYVTKMRRLIGSALYHRGALDQRLTRKLGFDKNPPVLESSNSKQQEEGANESAHLQ